MQSTKEEYHFTRDSFPPNPQSSQQELLQQQEALLLQHQKRLLSGDSLALANNKMSMKNFQTG